MYVREARISAEAEAAAAAAAMHEPETRARGCKCLRQYIYTCMYICSRRSLLRARSSRSVSSISLQQLPRASDDGLDREIRPQDIHTRDI